MQRIAKFEKVSFEEFQKDMASFNFNNDQLKEIYDDIKLPKRATLGSAGYDFYAPFDILLKPNEQILVPTGIRCKIDAGWVLKIYPRSGLGYKFHLVLANTVGIIDSDYYNALNEGHIMIKIINSTVENKTIEIKKGIGFSQGIFLEYGITVDDEVTDVRLGGFGSTTK